MKIGQVVQRYGVPVNTLYFYINSGLLVPPRRNSQYVFDQHTLEELEWLLELKELEFPLKTIHRLLSLRRISNFCSEEDRRELRAIFQEQADELKRRQAQISAARQQVGRKLFELESRPAAGTRTGVPVSMLHLLRCPNCGGELILENANMSPKYVFQAVLRCGCGYSAAIRDGILQTKNVNTSLFDKPDTTRELYRDLPSMTLSLYERSYRWLEENIRSGVSHGKVWLEGYVNAWFFFHNHLELLDSSDQLVVIDKFPETLLAYKAVIEQQNLPCDILYISDCSASPPLRENIIDCVMDFFAVNEHNFYHGDLYLNQLLPYLKGDCRLFGVYFFFRNGRASLRKLLSDYPESSPNNFNIRWFLREAERNFHILETTDCGFSLDSGDNLGLGFHIPGEELHLQPYCARLRSRNPGQEVQPG